MRKWGLASLASCAWFFDEISRLEPVNGLTFALRAMTVTGKTLGENLKDVKARIKNPDVIRSETPYANEGGIAILRGSLAPDGAVVKQSAVAPSMYCRAKT